MSTFITGAGGFVGLALSELLLARGEQVTGFDLGPLPASARARLLQLPGSLHWVEGDVRDAAALQQAMAANRPRALVTLAAITAGTQRECSANPAPIVEVNAGGSWNAIAAAAACGIQRIVHGSSGSVYGASGAVESLLDEATTPLQPEGLYGISKLAAEDGVLRLGQLHQLDLTIARIGTCFGPWEGDSALRDTPSAPMQILRLAQRGQRAILPRASRRDWLYVRDAAAALDALLRRSHLPHPVYNLGCGWQWSLADWCRQLGQFFPDFAWTLAMPGDRPANVDCYADYDRAPMAVKRLFADTDFRPSYSLPAAMRDLLDWQRSTEHASRANHGPET